MPRQLNLPRDLALLWVGSEPMPVARYTLSDHQGYFYSLSSSPTNVEYSDLRATMRALLAHVRDPHSYAFDRLRSVMGLSRVTNPNRTTVDGYGFEGHVTNVELFTPEQVRDSLPFGERQMGNIQMAFARLEPRDSLVAARIFAEHDLPAWSAFEVCEAIDNGVSDPLVRGLAKAELSYKQVRALRYLAQDIIAAHQEGNVQAHELFRALATPSVPFERTQILRRILSLTDFKVDQGWLSLTTDQLRSVRFALADGVDRDTLARYATGAFPAVSMDLITYAIREHVEGDALNRLLDASYGTGQLSVTANAAIQFEQGALSEAQLGLICNPALSEETMNALRLGFAYHDLPAEVVVGNLTPETTPEQVWELVAQAQEPEEPQQAGAGTHEAVKADVEAATPDASSLRDEAKESRAASGQLAQEHGNEQAPQHEELE